MKRLLSAILSLAMILALVPAVFAAGEIQELEITTTTAFQNPGTGAATLTVDNGTASLTAMQVRRYAVTSDNGPVLAFVFTAANTGDYILEFKTDATGITNKATAAAPGVYIVNKKIAGNTTFKGITGNTCVNGVLSQNGLVGYFDFSKLEKADDFVPMTIGTNGVFSGEPVKVSLTKGSWYTIALFCDGTSLNLNNKTLGGDVNDFTVSATGGISVNDATLDSGYKQNIYISGVRLTPVVEEPEEDEELKAAFKPDNSDVTVFAPSVDAITTVTGTSATEQTDGSYKMVAPETDANGNKFLYWAKGLSLNKKIVSLEREFTYTPATGDRNYLIPVYVPESATGNEYYNANGQLIDCATEAPALPSMAGYGEASGWAQYEDTNIYVAEYDNKTQPEDVKVTVNGTEKTVPYGTDITCTADDKDADNKPFKCWTKSNINGKEEIVSCDKNYTFKAWEACLVTAVYEEHIYTGAKMKIIIDSFMVGSETGIMAEFIGLDNAVEKGIMFGTQKIAMTKPGTQFTVTADESGTYKGYAIVEDGEGGYTLITDGAYTK